MPSHKKLFLLILTLSAISIISFLPTTFALPQGNAVTIHLPAVYFTSEGETGVLTNLTVIVTNGTGHVFVDTAPFTQVDMQGSARVAAMVASDLTNIDSSHYDFYYIVKVDSPIIGGPSAGGAMTVATIASIKGWKINNSIVMTGTINPDGSIGPVGGIPAKLKASADGGANMFLVPEGQSKVSTVKRVLERRGPFVIISQVPEEIDLKDLGKNLDVKVEEVSTVRDAVYLFTGNYIPQIILTGEVPSEEYTLKMQPLASTLLNESISLYNTVVDLADSSFYSTLEEQRITIQKAQEEFNNGNYYSSTSLSFGTMISLKYILWSSEYLNSWNKDKYLTNLMSKVEKQINTTEKDIKQFHNNLSSVSDIGSLGAAESRVTLAQDLFTQSKQSKRELDAIRLLAYANERARSAQWWLNLSLDTSTPYYLQEGKLKDRAGRYYSQAVSIKTYAETLLSPSTTHFSDILKDADKDLTQARFELQNGYYAGAIFDSLHGMVKASTAIELLGTENIEEKIKKSRNLSRSSILEARNNGIEPILAVSAYEHADTLSESKFDKIIGFSYAKMIAKSSMSLAKMFNQSNFRIRTQNINQSIKTTPPIMPQPTLKTPTPTPTPSIPGFGIIIAVLILILIYKVFIELL
ncbi:MAG: S16 family serine protease [Methanosarcinales archaeon]